MAWRSKEHRNEWERRNRQKNGANRREYEREYRARNKEKLNARRRESAQTDPEKRERLRSREYKRAWREANRERERKKATDYSRSRRNVINEQRKLWRSQRPPESQDPKRVVYMKEYAKKNEETLKQKRKEFYEANRERLLPRMREQALNRWLRIAGWTREELERRKALGCQICGVKAELGKGGLVFDHDHDTGEVRGLLCARCNKFLDWAIDFYEEIGRYHRSSVEAVA